MLLTAKGWSEGRSILQEAMDEVGEGDGVKAGFFVPVEPRRED